MPNIKPISELRNYGELLREVTVGSPVFLTKTDMAGMLLWTCTIMRKCRRPLN